MCLSSCIVTLFFCFFFSSRRRHTRCLSDWSSDVCSSDLLNFLATVGAGIIGVSILLFIVNVLISRKGGMVADANRSEERRVGKECRSRWSRYNWKKKQKE